MFLYIGTSKGLYKYNLKNKKLTNIFGNWHKGLFKRPSKGVFGICEDIDNNIGMEIISEICNVDIEIVKKSVHHNFIKSIKDYRVRLDQEVIDKITEILSSK